MADVYTGIGGTIQNPGFFSRVLSGVGGWMQKNPETFALTADAVGSRLNPNNPFAGIGTNMAKSSLAEKAEKQRNSKQDAIMKLVQSLTPAGTPGADSMTFKMGPNGLELTSKALLGSEQGSRLSGDAVRSVDGTAGVANTEGLSLMEALAARARGGQ